MRALQPVNTKAPRIYLAGKISRDDWRRAFLDQSDIDMQCLSGVQTWPVLPKAVLGVFDYTGPYFAEEGGHGQAHGDSSHGVAASGDWYEHNHEPPSKARRARVLNLCRQAISSADFVFAWIDTPDAYGTIAEIGYAAALGKRVWIAMPKELDDLWFVQQMAINVCIGIQQPEHALASMLLAAGEANPAMMEMLAKAVK